MKPALRWLPTEVWVDIFCFPWIGRREMGQLAYQIGNRKFAEFLQFYLHEWGKRTLRTMWLVEALPHIPRTPMPENIKFFKKIAICYLDAQSLDFLRRISSLFLFNEVNLDFDIFGSGHRAQASVRTVLGHLTPLLHGIHSLAIDHTAIPLVEQHFGPKLAQIKMLAIDLNPDDDEPFYPAGDQVVNFCLNWLTSAQDRDPIEPKFLGVYFCSEVQQLSMAVQQQFQSAKRPSTFVIKVLCYNPELDFQLDLENTIGEQLHGKFDEHGYFWIFRHPVGSTRAQLEEWVKKMVEKRDNSSRIEFYPQLTIGPIDADAGPNGVDEDAGGEADGPSTSKKH